MLKLAALIRTQYSLTPVGSRDVSIVMGAAPAIGAPIYAVAAAQETERGETAEKMEGWRALTSAPDFALATVDGSHLGCMRTGEGGLFELILARLHPLLAPA